MLPKNICGLTGDQLSAAMTILSAVECYKVVIDSVIVGKSSWTVTRRWTYRWMSRPGLRSPVLVAIWRNKGW